MAPVGQPEMPHTPPSASVFAPEHCHSPAHCYRAGQQQSNTGKPKDTLWLLWL